MAQKLRSISRRLLARRRWLTPGLGVKRWLLLLAFGAAITGISWFHIIATLKRQEVIATTVGDTLMLHFLPLWLRIALPLIVGGLFIFWSVVQITKTVVAPLRTNGRGVVDSLYNYRLRDRGPRIVAIGGGTGLPGLLRGLVEYTSNITAIITVADDGGSSGRIRRELGLLPPGDFRNNIAALAQDESLMFQLLQYRFGGRAGERLDKKGRGELQGHAFGNLLLAALTGITGSFDEALLAAQRVLAMRGRVFPSTLEDVTLVAEIAITADDGEQIAQIAGESLITEAGGRIERVMLQPPYVRAYPPALRAIFQADLIILGPGSLYTSILPNLLVADLAEALAHAHAPKLYICNLAMQPGETDGYTVRDHVQAILQHTQGNLLDAVLANDNLTIPPETGGGHTRFVRPTQPDHLPLFTADLVDEQQPWRHDSRKLASAVMDILDNPRPD